MPLLRRLAALLLLEGVSLTAVGVVYAIVSRSDGAADGQFALYAALFAVATGVVLALLARAVDRQRAWARAPAVVLNVLPMPVGLTALESGAWYAAIPLLLLPASVLYLFATPDLRELFRER